MKSHEIMSSRCTVGFAERWPFFGKKGVLNKALQVRLNGGSSMRLGVLDNANLSSL